jgi:predicted Fe-Mo cluster-binding NifX family protein
MKLAIPVFSDRVSSVFDFTHCLLVLECESGREVTRTEVAFQEDLPLNRARRLETLGVQLLICGSISRLIAEHLQNVGIGIIPLVSGSVDEVLRAYLRGDLGPTRFLMPGSTAKDREEWTIRRPACESAVTLTNKRS